MIVWGRGGVGGQKNLGKQRIYQMICNKNTSLNQNKLLSIRFASILAFVRLRKRPDKKSAIFFNIVQTEGGVIPMLKNYVGNFV